MSRRIINEVGNRYGQLLVIEEAGRNKRWDVLWKCLCDCGNSKVINGKSLRNGDTRSCGCLRRILPVGQSNFNTLYSRYKRAAKRRGFIWELTKEDFSFITKMNCHYCGNPPAQEYTPPKSNGSYTYNGIDRINNEKGYTLDNIVPCCGRCNLMKRSQAYGEFLDQVFKIASYRSMK